MCLFCVCLILVRKETMDLFEGTQLYHARAFVQASERVCAERLATERVHDCVYTDSGRKCADNDQ